MDPCFDRKTNKTGRSLPELTTNLSKGENIAQIDNGLGCDEDKIL
jgi:hypothetical protein